MKLQPMDLAIIVVYFLAVILIELWVSRRGSKDMDSYFLSGEAQIARAEITSGE
jgi:hypothetical protein